VTIYVGVDVGGTTSTVAIGNQDREVLSISDQFATRSADGPDATIADIVSQIRLQLQRVGHTTDDVAHITLATPGPATKDGVLLSTPNLSAEMWNRCPIRSLLETAWMAIERERSVPDAIPVSYIGDGQAAAVGEFVVRTGGLRWSESPISQPDSFDSLFMVAVGTGLGGGEVRDGIPTTGSKGRAGHAGHLMLPLAAFRHEHDRMLKVGNAYCTAESAISLTALTHQLSYRLTIDPYRDHPLNRQNVSAKDKAKQLRELAAEGDALALELLDDQARALGMTMLMINYIGDYDRLVIGGGVCDMAKPVRDRYLQIVRDSYHEHALEGFRDFDQFHFSVCNDSASVIGALAIAMG
jgi:glucokinase